LGLIYEYHYNGSRLGTKDYSGVYSFDQYLNTNQIGLKVDYSMISIDRIVLKTGVNVGANLTNWETISNLELGNNGEYSAYRSISLVGLSWSISPSFKFGYKIIKNAYLFGCLDYSFELFKKYHSVGPNDINLSQKPDWNGFKWSLVLEFSLK
jgi:hypothetical protein